MVPHLRVAHALFGAGGQRYHVVVESEGTDEVECEVEHTQHLVFHLIGAAEDVGVVLGEAAHTHGAVQGAAALVTIDGAKLAEAQGQVAVAAQGRLVDHDVEGAVHGLQEVLLALHIHGRVHGVAVEVEVAAGLPQVGAADVRRVDEVVAALAVQLAPVVFGNGANHRALRVPDNQAGADLLVGAEETKLASQAPMVPLLRLLQPG